MAADWLADAVIYEIYPQSFADSDGDGIGDLPGVIDRLDHLAWLGVDTVWFNPCFASPFVDAGYDVSDYLHDRAALRHQRRPGRAGRRGPASAASGCCSTSWPGTPRSSTQWFQGELHADGPTPRATATSGASELPSGPGRRTSRARRPWVRVARPAAGLVPQELLRRAARAELRLGRSCRTTSPGATPSTRPGPRRNRQALKDIMAFWLDRGVAGFRVDMAFSLVKDDRDRGSATTTDAVARDPRRGSTRPTPTPCSSRRAPSRAPARRSPFDADFFLVIHAEHAQPVRQRRRGRAAVAASRVRRSSTPTGWARPARFLDGWDGRPRRPTRRDRCSWRRPTTTSTGWPRAADAGAARRRAARSCSPGASVPVPLLRRRDRHALPAGPAGRRGQRSATRRYNRAGCRTPMQWDDGPNAGLLHRRRPTGSTCRSTPTRTGRRSPRRRTTPTRRSTSSARLIALRRATPALGGRAATTRAARGLPVRLPPRRDPPGRGQPAARGRLGEPPRGQGVRGAARLRRRAHGRDGAGRGVRLRGHRPGALTWPTLLSPGTTSLPTTSTPAPCTTSWRCGRRCSWSSRSAPTWTSTGSTSSRAPVT